MDNGLLDDHLNQGKKGLGPKTGASMLYLFKLALALVAFNLLGLTGLICAVIALFL